MKTLKSCEVIVAVGGEEGWKADAKVEVGISWEEKCES
jgi:hypothetical protein